MISLVFYVVVVVKRVLRNFLFFFSSFFFSFSFVGSVGRTKRLVSKL